MQAGRTKEEEKMENNLRKFIGWTYFFKLITK